MTEYTITRKPTEKEFSDYERVEELTADMDEDEFVDMLDTLDECFTGSGDKAKANEIAESLGVSIEALENWYFTEEAC